MTVLSKRRRAVDPRFAEWVARPRGRAGLGAALKCLAGVRGLQNRLSFDLVQLVCERAVELFGTRGLLAEVPVDATLVCVSDCGRWLAAAAAEELSLFCARTGRRVRRLHDVEDAHSLCDLRTVVFTPDGQWLLASYEEELHLWETETGRCVCAAEDGHVGSICSVAVVQERHTQALHVRSVDVLGVVATWVAPASSQRRLHLQSTKPSRLGPGPAWTVPSVHDFDSCVLEPRARRIARVENNGTVMHVQALGVPWGNGLRLQHSSRGEMFVACFDPSGRFLATGGGQTLRMWELSSRPALRAQWCLPECASVTCFGFSHRGRKLAVGCCDGCVRVYVVGTRECWGEVAVHVHARVANVAWAADDESLAVAAAGRVGLWSVPL